MKTVLAKCLMYKSIFRVSKHNMTALKCLGDVKGQLLTIISFPPQPSSKIVINGVAHALELRLPISHLSLWCVNSTWSISIALLWTFLQGRGWEGMIWGELEMLGKRLQRGKCLGDIKGQLFTTILFPPQSSSKVVSKELPMLDKIPDCLSLWCVNSTW